MGYSDQKYYSYDLDKIQTAIAFGTATASGTSTKAVPAGIVQPTFQQNTIIAGVEWVCTTSPNSAQGGLLQVLNGTNTIITATYTASITAGQEVYGSYTGTYTTTGTATKDAVGAVPKNVILSGATFIAQLVLNTATASGDVTGSWDLYINDAAHV